jgi:anti-sigma regulatory factor (Ser/Thr protein kinase)
MILCGLLGGRGYSGAVSQGPARRNQNDTAKARAPAEVQRATARETVSLEVELPRSVEAPREARDAAAHLCHQRRLPSSLRPDLLLLVSEIVTNAVTHGEGGHGDPFLLTAVVGPDTVRVALSGSGQGFTRATGGGTEGYGVYLLDRIATHWGVEPTGEAGGTRVWFELSADRYPYSDARRHRLAM